MRRLLVLLSICLISATLYAEVKVSLASGDVAVFVNNQWMQANEGAVLNTSDKIKTSENSIAILIVDGKTQIWVNEKSELSVGSLGQESFFDLLAGMVRSKVKLIQGQKFRIKTPVSVATVRGTDFVVTYEGDLFVFEGRVEFTNAKMKHLVMVAKDQIGSIRKGKMVAPRDMSIEEKAKLEDAWKAFIQKQISKIIEQDEEQTLNLRKEMYQIVSETKNDIKTAKDIMNEMKESDFSAGITRRDMYGNVVRFEQYLLRPDENSYEIVSIVKSKDYTTDILTSKRLDVFDETVTMNMALPKQISAWQQSAVTKGNDLYPVAVDVVVSNITDSGRTSNNITNPGTETADSNTDENSVDPNTVNPNPVDQNPVTPTPVNPTPVNPTPVDPTPVVPTPVNPTPVNPTPVTPPTPVDPTPVAPTPVNPTPVDPTPVAPTPVDPTPVVPTPVNPTPVNPTPVAPIPVNPTPVTPPTPADPTPVAPTPVNPTPVAPTPANPTPVTPTPVNPTPVTPMPVNPTPVTPTPVNPSPVAPTPVSPTPIAPTPVTPTVTLNPIITNTVVQNTRTNIITNLINSLIRRLNYMPITIKPISIVPAKNQRGVNQKAHQNDD